MPSPFPGMDPYLEAPARWRGIQIGLVVCLSRALNTNLPPGFAADIRERVYLQNEDEKAQWPDYERERFIEVVSTDDAQRVVAVIEVLSPANKTPGAGRREYLSKQKALLGSETHLLEIDLLRAGGHTVAVPERAVREQTPAWNYLFCLHWGGEDEHYQYWAKTVRDPLPRKLLVPLTEGVPDTVLDLQTVFEEVYEAGRYPRKADYAAPPFPRLTPEDDAWANALLQAACLRPPLPSPA